MNAVAPAVASLPTVAGRSGGANNSPAESAEGTPADFAALLSGQLPATEEIAALLPKDLRALLLSGQTEGLEQAIATEAEAKTETEAALVLPFEVAPLPDPLATAFALPVLPAEAAPQPADFSAKDRAGGAIAIGNADAELKELASDLEALLGKKAVPEATTETGAQSENLRDLGAHPPVPQTMEVSAKQDAARDLGPVATPLHSSRWSQDFGQKLVWMVKNDVHSAQLSITPENLGPIEVTLSIAKDTATAHFASPFAEVREVLEAALPRLKEMLAGAGIELGQANVGAQSQQRFADAQAQQQSGRTAEGRASTSFGPSDAVIEPRVMPLSGRGLGLVDTFA